LSFAVTTEFNEIIYCN